MPRRLRDSPSCPNSISSSCLGEPRVNSSPTSSKISRSSPSASSLTRVEMAARRSVSSFEPGPLHLAQNPDQRQLDLLHQVGQAAPADLLALPVRQRPHQQRVGPSLLIHIGRQSPLLAQLAERIGPAGRLQQVGADLGVVGQHLRDLAQRLGIVSHHRAAARAPPPLPRAARASPTQTRSVPGGGWRTGRLGSGANRASSGLSGGLTASATSRCGSLARSATVAGRSAGSEHPLGLRRRRGRVG